MGGFDGVKYEAAKTYITTALLTKKALQELCEKLDIVIELGTKKTRHNCKTILGSNKETITKWQFLQLRTPVYFICNGKL